MSEKQFDSEQSRETGNLCFLSLRVRHTLLQSAGPILLFSAVVVSHIGFTCFKLLLVLTINRNFFCSDCFSAVFLLTFLIGWFVFVHGRFICRLMPPASPRHHRWTGTPPAHSQSPEDPYYCGLQARVPNFAARNRKPGSGGTTAAVVAAPAYGYAASGETDGGMRDGERSDHRRSAMHQRSQSQYAPPAQLEIRKSQSSGYLNTLFNQSSGFFSKKLDPHNKRNSASFNSNPYSDSSLGKNTCSSTPRHAHPSSADPLHDLTASCQLSLDSPPHSLLH